MGGEMSWQPLAMKSGDVEGNTTAFPFISFGTMYLIIIRTGPPTWTATGLQHATGGMPRDQRALQQGQALSQPTRFTRM